MSFRSIALLFLATASGCASISDCHYYYVNKSRAKSAWRAAQKCLPEDRCCKDFAKGYQAGYLDVSRGGDGTAPPVPPSCYWGPAYQTCEGLALVNKWYEGFAQGACDSLHEGRNRWHNVPSQPCNYCAETIDGTAPCATPYGDIQYLHHGDTGVQQPMAPVNTGEVPPVASPNENILPPFPGPSVPY
jgi:hypothetical protein